MSLATIVALASCIAAVTFGQIPAPSCQPLDLAITIDSSGSICDPSFNNVNNNNPCNNWSLMRAFVYSFVSSLTISPSQTRISVVMFANQARILWPLDRYIDKSSLLTAINSLNYTGGWTNTADALLQTIQVFRGPGERPSIPNAAIIITDSHPTINVAALPSALDAIRQTNVAVYSIGATNFIDEVTLKSLSSPPQLLNQNYFTSTSFTTINDVIPSIQRSLCASVVTPGIFSTDRLVEVTTTTAAQPTSSLVNCVTTMKDLVLVVDASGSICEADPSFVLGVSRDCSNWLNLLRFILDLCDSFTIGPLNTRVALVVFNETARIEWRLSTYNDKPSLLAAITSLRYQGGFTDTGEALIKLMQAFGSGDDRPDAANVALVVTDAMSNLDPGKLKDQLAILRVTPIQVYAVGVTQSVDRIALKALSSPPQILDQNYFLSSSYAEMDKIRSEVEESVCSDVTTTMAATPTLPTTTTTTIATTTTTPTTTTTTTTTTVPTTTTTKTITSTAFCNDEVLDIVLVLDSSGSICDSDPGYLYGRDISCNNWRMLLKFVADLVASFNVSPSSSLFSLVRFHSLSQLMWDFNRYQSRDVLLQQIQGLSFGGGWTDTAGGIRTALQVLNGVTNRPNVHDVIIIITDGEPTTNLDDLPFQLNEVRRLGVEMFSVGVTRAINETTLRSLSSPPHVLNKNYFMSRDFTQVSQITSLIRNQICRR